jgi:sulfate permease, SulP family
VIPQALAYATIAGLPVQVGLDCALVPMAVYALLGSSRPLSVSTTSTLSILTAEAIARAGPGNDPLTVASTRSGETPDPARTVASPTTAASPRPRAC